jgi:hypothetical protein
MLVSDLCSAQILLTRFHWSFGPGGPAHLLLPPEVKDAGSV